MKIAGFEFSEGARFQAGAVLNANEVGQHLELLRTEAKGELTPEDVLKDAANPNSPLHGFFEWDDTEAARQHRLKQARGLIRCVVAIYTSDEKPAVRQRAYVHIAQGEASHYRESQHAMSQKKTRDQVLRRAWTELKAWRDRYRDLVQFAKLVEVIDEVAETLPASVRK